MPVVMGRRRLLFVALIAASALAVSTLPSPAAATEADTAPPSVDDPPTTVVETPRADDPPPEEGTPPPPPPDDPQPPNKEEPIPPPAKDEPTGPTPSFAPVKRIDVLRELVFPVAGPVKYHAAFGDCRDGCTREHHGIDITTRGWKGLPVVAAHDGTVVKVTYDQGNAGCSVRIRGRDRWETRYLHLNNDFAGTDEIGAPCPAPGIELGTRVRAGQIIGYVGDSGNSETTSPHLHFELRNRSGYPIDPYRSLRDAEEIRFEWLPADRQTAMINLSSSWKPDLATSLIVISAIEMAMMTPRDEGTLILEAPVVAIDRKDPTPALAEIERLSPDRIVVMSDADENWLSKIVHGRAPIIDTAIPPTASIEPTQREPDAVEPAPFEHDRRDRFVTIVAGAVDRIRTKARPIYDSYIATHRSFVLAGDRWGHRGVGQTNMTRPRRSSDRTHRFDTARGWPPRAECSWSAESD